MISSLKLYHKWQSLNIAADLQYRIDYIIMVLASSLEAALTIVAFFVFTDKFNLIGGWNFWQLSFIYGIWRICDSLATLVFQQGWEFDSFISEGTFDRFLLRPQNVLLQLFCIRFQIVGLAQLIVGIVTTVVSSNHINLAWNSMNILFLLITVVSGCIIEISLILLVSSLSFWIIRAGSITRIILSVNYSLMQYPLDIYGNGIKFLTSFVLPFAFMSYYPCRHFISNGSIISPIYIYLSPLIAITLFIISYNFFFFGIRRYNSTGN